MSKKSSLQICKICGAESKNGEIFLHKNVEKLITTDYKILFSSDYNIFSFYQLNRDIDPNKVQEYYNVLIHGGDLPPIMVSDKFDGTYEIEDGQHSSTHKIGDGQHRFEAWKMAGRDIVYMIWNNMNMNIIPDLNRVKGWVKNDYVKAHSNKPEFIFYKEMMDTYNKGAYILTRDVLLAIMGGDNGTTKPKDFDSGNLKLSNEEEAREIIEKIHRYQEALLTFEEDGFKIYSKKPGNGYICDRMLKGLLKFI